MRALICIHGLLSNHGDFSFYAQTFKNYYDYIACYDLPGHGQNKLKFNTNNIKNFILNVYDSLSSKFEIIDVIGYSMGGVIACYLQSVRRVNKLVLLAPAYRYLNLKNYHFRVQDSSNSKITSVLPKKNYFHIFRFAKIIYDLSDEFKIIYPKTLIIWGQDDYLVKEESGHLLYEMVRNKDKRYLKLAGHNHFNIVFSNVVLNVVNSFLNE